MRTTTIKPGKNRGFTLIEMALVVLILGIMTTAFAQVYDLHRKNVAIENTADGIDITSKAIGDFRALHGRYPCPASLTLPPTNPNYGREDCVNFTTVPGDCDNGICVRQSTRTFAYINPNDPLDVGVKPARVLVGALPFRNLNLEERFAYDGHHNRLMYVATEHLTNADSYQSNGGGIDVRGNAGTTSILPTPETAHFMVYSVGENEIGAFTRAGQQKQPCPASGLESFNCSLTQSNASFRVTQKSYSNDANNRNDDVMSFFTPKDMTPWQLSGHADHKTDAHLRADGKNVGFGINAEATPADEVQVNGILRLQDDPDTTNSTEGKLQAEEICDINDSSKCFKSSIIAGETQVQVINGQEVNVGGGLFCPTGTFMKGIQDGKPVCEKEFELKCGDGKFMAGVDSKGKLICNEPPKNGCPATTVSLCSQDVSLPAKPHQGTAVAEAGHNKKQPYKCDEGTWKKHGNETGQCACTPDNTTYPEEKVDCAYWDDQICGKGYTGKKIVQKHYVCPAGQSGYWKWDELQRDCKCKNTQKPDETSCPSKNNYSYNEGRQHGYKEHICPNGDSGWGYCSGFIYKSDNCKCKPVKGQTKSRDCPDNFSGTYKVRSDFVCDGPAISPASSPSGRWTGEKEVPGDGIADNCYCEDGKKLSDHKEECQDPYQGYIHYPRYLECPNGNPKVVIDWNKPDNKCTLPEPPKCYWTTGEYVDDEDSSRKAGQQCACSQDGIKLCEEGGQRYRCECK